MVDKKVHINALPDILTPQQAADFLGISRRRIYEFCQRPLKSGGLSSFRLGATRKIKKAALLDWVDRRETQEEVLHAE